MELSDDTDRYQTFEELRRNLLESNTSNTIDSSGRSQDNENNTPIMGQLSEDDDNNIVDHHHHYDHNQQQQHHHSSSSTWFQNPYQIIAMISNFSTSYNVVNISLVLPILEQIHTDATSEDAAACASSLLAGMIVGQLVGGALGDSRLGRLGALRLVMALQIIASVASATLGMTKQDEISHEDIFLWLASCRFVVGIGCGGVYPLAAVLSAEQGNADEEEQQRRRHHHDTSESIHTTQQDESESKKDDSIHRVVLTFSTQGLGFVTVPIVAVMLLYSTTNLNFVWRAMLFFGALPGIAFLLLEYKLSRKKQHAILVPTDDHVIPDHDVATGTGGELENDSVLTSEADDEDNQQTEANQEESDVVVEVVQGSHEGWIQSMFHEPGLGRKVIGSAGSWFLFDVVFYGNTIFQPIVVEAAFGGKGGTDGLDLLRKTAIDSLLLTSIALPGYAVAGIIMGKKTCCIVQTPRYVMLQGFAAMSILYATIGFNWSYLRGYPAMLVLLYGMTFFFANYGPNTTTFILPSLIFEKEHRATWNGISAAAGKIGALAGATLFEPAADAFGDNSVMIICAIVALAGYILTYCAVPKQQTDHDRPHIIETEDTTTSPLDQPNTEVV